MSATIRHSVGLLVAATLAACFVPVPADAAGYDGVFQAAASAHGLRVQVLVPNAPVSSTVVDGGGPAAAAALDSIGESRAYASLPFPGENVATAPGLVRGLSGAPVPDYACYVASSYPSVPEHKFDNAGVELVALSSEKSSAGRARSVLTPGEDAAVGLADSEAVTANAADGVLSSARTELTGFRVGPLTVARVVSEAKLTLSSTGSIERSSRSRISGVEVDGQPVEVTAATAGPLAEVLAAAGLKVEIVPAAESDSGVTAPALRITRELDTGETVVLTLGIANASIHSTGQ